MRGERRIYTKGKKVGNFSCVSTTFVHDCSLFPRSSVKLLPLINMSCCVSSGGRDNFERFGLWH